MYRFLILNFLLVFNLSAMDGVDVKYFETLEKLRQDSSDYPNLESCINHYALYQELKEILIKLENNLEIEDAIQRQIENEKLFSTKHIQELFQYIFATEYFLVKSPYRELVLEQLYHRLQIQLLNCKNDPNKNLDWIKSLPKFPQAIEKNILLLLMPIISKECTYFKVKEEYIQSNADKSILLAKRVDGLPPTLLFTQPVVANMDNYLSQLKYETIFPAVRMNQLRGNGNFELMEYIGSKQGNIIIATIKESMFNTINYKLILFKKDGNAEWKEIKEIKEVKCYQVRGISDNESFVLFKVKENPSYYSIFNINSGKTFSIRLISFKEHSIQLVGNYLYMYTFKRYKYDNRKYQIYEIKEDSLKLIRDLYAHTTQLTGIIDYKSIQLLQTSSSDFSIFTKRPSSYTVNLKLEPTDNPICFSENGLGIGKNNNVYMKIYSSNTKTQSLLTTSKSKTFRDILYSVLK